MTDVTGRLQSLLPSAQTPLGYLFWLSRPRFWLYLAGPVVVGVVYAASTPSEFFTPVTLALFAYFLLPANIFLYGVNDIFDSEIDEANPKKAADGKEVRYSGESTIWLIVVGSAVLGLGFVPVLPLEGTLALVGFLFLGTFYSAPPLRFKTTPFVDSFSNGLYILPAVVAFAAVSGEAPPVMAILAGWVWAMGMHTFSADSGYRTGHRRRDSNNGNSTWRAKDAWILCTDVAARSSVHGSGASCARGGVARVSALCCWSRTR